MISTFRIKANAYLFTSLAKHALTSEEDSILLLVGLFGLWNKD
jgi:hypothetical protein